MKRSVWLYALWAIVTTWPLILHLGTTLPGPYLTDQSFEVWGIDTVLRAFHEPHWWETTRILVPRGLPLSAMMVALPLAPFAVPFWGSEFGRYLFFDLLTPLSIIAAGCGMQRLVTKLTGHQHVAWWSGLLYASSPAFLSFVQSPWHFKIVGYAIFPWALTTLLHWQRTGAWTSVLIASGWAWLLLLLDYYLAGMFLVIASVFVFVAWRWPLLRSALIGLGVNILIVTTILFLAPPFDPNDINLGAGYWPLAHANLQGYFLPGWYVATHGGAGAGNVEGSGLLWSGVLGSLWDGGIDIGPDPDSYYLGIGVLGLMLVALLRQPSRVAWGLALGALLAALMATGNKMAWGSTVLLENSATPWEFLVMHGPKVFQGYDLPRCFALAVMPGVIAVAGIGLAHIRSPKIVALVAGTIFLIEYARVGIPLETLPVPDVYRILAAHQDNRTVLELPRGIAESKGALAMGDTVSVGMYWQVIHQHPTVSAYTSRIPRSTHDYFLRTPIIRELLLMTSQQGHTFSDDAGVEYTATQLGTYPPAMLEEFLCTFDLGYIVFQPIPEMMRYRAEVDRVFSHYITNRTEIAGWTLYSFAPCQR